MVLKARFVLTVSIVPCLRFLRYLLPPWQALQRWSGYSTIVFSFSDCMRWVTQKGTGLDVEFLCIGFRSCRFWSSLLPFHFHAFAEDTFDFIAE